MAESVPQFHVRISTFFWSTMLCFLHLCGLRVTLSFARLLMGWTNRRHWACLGGCAFPSLGRAIDLASSVDHVLVLMEMFQLCQTKWAKSAHGQKKRRLRDASQEIPYTGCPQILHQVLLFLGRSLRADAWEGGNWTRIRGRQKIQPLH